ncbi:PilC/PilY family type IV pilus protein [Pseudoxanthomonas sp. Soil82]|uniref:pilus assembly protein n=1 Tax=Pseudoxanthomonas sp. Soil82 TaxID=3157341 RepID=UPI00338E6EE3
MALRRTQIAAISAAMVAVLAGGYGLYLTAQAVPPELAQAPMNITNVIPPAFIMGVDNSGSMSTDETLFRTATGPGYFNNGSFFNGADLRESGGTAITKHMDGGYNADYYGALRNPTYNRAFFDPTVQYLPWHTSTEALEADADPAAAAEDPRGAGVGAANPFTTYDFTNYLTTSENWLNGKVVPAGTWVYNNDACDRAPGSTTTENAWVQYTSEKTLDSNCNIQFRYYPARVYLDTTAPAPAGFDITKRVLVRGAGPNGADMYRYDYLASNFTTGGAEAVQNFANWWTYYGNRNRAMIAAMTHSLADFSRMRVGVFRINPSPPTGDVAMRDLNVQADRDALYAAMRGLDASGNTPTRRATAYMIKQFQRTDDAAPITLQCQKNAAMLFTDGYTNDNNSGLTGILNVGDADNGEPAPYGGGVASTNTIADYAMYGYNTNPRPDLPAGFVPVPNECDGAPADGVDCNENLHVNFYGVTLGARGAIYDVNAAATADPYANPPSWGATGGMNLDPRNVDDIWHASLNSRGEFINANSPAEITAAMRRILATVNEGASPSGTIGVTGSRVGTGSLTVEPRYESTNNGTDWYGRLQAYTVTANSLTGEASFANAWEAAAKIEAQGAAARNIHYGVTTTSVNPDVRSFVPGTLTLADLCGASDALKVVACSASGIAALDGGSMTVDRAVAYLRGDRTDEGDLRTRTTVLGDIVNSSPVISAPTDDYGYRSLGGSLASSYETYLASKASAARPLVLVGANDGMLHVFDGRATGSGGDEVFAYIPATSLSHMGNLLFPYDPDDKSNQDFDHRYFVDGQIAVSDVYMGGGWKTVAVVSSGAGGRSVFALDITDPSSIQVLWEVNDRITGNPGISNNIGYVLGQPVIVPFKTAAGGVSWKAIFGNGYNSGGQQASLFVVDVATGATTTIVASEATAPAYNGLGNVAVVDVKRRNLANDAWVGGRDGFADTVYAADQNGAVWKFDLLTASVDLGGEPLFIAQNGGARQPITGGLTAATGPGGGVMVYFGTGSFIFTGDPLNTDIQTMYGVLDRGLPVAGRASLQQQTVGADGGGFRQTTNDALGAGKSGWYIDLPAGERMVGYPRIESGVVFFPTYEPSATGADDCSVNGTNWLYGLNALSGGAAMTSVRMGSPTGGSPSSTTGAVALNTGGSAPVKDVAVMTSPRVQPLGAGATQAEIDSALAAQCSMVIRVAGAPAMYLPRPCGRQSWRQVR